MRKIALFENPLQTQGTWVDPLTVETHPFAGETYGEGEYVSSFQTQAGQSVNFDAAVYMSNSVDEATDISIDFWVNGTQELTGKGEAFQIFATIIKLTTSVYDQVRHKMPQDHVILVVFQAAGSSLGRKKLYAKLAYGLAAARGGEVNTQGGFFNVKFEPQQIGVSP